MVKKHQLMALSLGFLGAASLATLLAVSAQGQGRGGFGFAAASHGAGTGSRGRATGGPFGRMHHRRRAFAGSGYGPNYYPYYDGYYDSGYYSDYDSQDAGSQEPPPPFRAPTAAPAQPENPPKPAESLVMELRGDHWVRLTSYGPMDIPGQSGEPRSVAPQAKGTVASHTAQTQSELPPAVLVFRDGHREEVAKYTIVGTTISVMTDYWKTGSWTRKIPIAELNLAATLQANQERGAKFSLPSRPSEVIVR
jgi:hypothetical protein